MKKIFNIALWLMCSFCIFTACEDDRDDNPVLLQPTEFILHTPSNVADPIDLSSAEGVKLSWEQPAYTDKQVAVIATYEIQLSATGSFTTSLDEADADESGATKADYVTLDATTTLRKATLGSELVNKALMQLCQWEEDQLPETQEAYIRVHASVSGRNPIASNAVKFICKPYYVELANAPIEMWYLIGGCIGDGQWNNSLEGIGTSMYPMSVVDGYAYSKKTGKGVLTFTGYLTTDGFKLVMTPGSWDDQWGSSDGGTTCVKNDGQSQNITVPANGYYTITLDTQNDQMTVEAADVAPAVYPSMLISGPFNGWAESTAMTAVNTTANVAAHNHIWSYVLDATDGATEAKFLQPGWAPNWGGSAFPNGIGTDGGSNIPVTQGKWMVTFNDIDGSYTFTAL